MTGGDTVDAGDTERFTDQRCGHCGGWMMTDGSDLWCPESHSDPVHLVTDGGVP
jgi:hypothetical protein